MPIGTEGPDLLIGTAGDDFLIGLGGNDQLWSGTGSDFLYGGSGNDVLYFGAAFDATDIADGGSGRDVVVLQGNYTSVLSASNLVDVEALSLQTGANTRWSDPGGNSYDYNITSNDANVGGGQQLIINGESLGAGEDLRFDGSAETDGAFIVFGGQGTDTLAGGAGADQFVFWGTRWGTNDSVNGGAGSDQLIFAADANTLLHVEFGPNSFTGIETISVNNPYRSAPNVAPSYEFVLDAANVPLNGILTIDGRSLAANQTISIDAHAVQFGSLILYGGDGTDNLTGGQFWDALHGGWGGDTLTGGEGGDSFMYEFASESRNGAPDMVTDFEEPDEINLLHIDANTWEVGDQAFTWIGGMPFGGIAGELRAVLGQDLWIVEGDIDGDTIADLLIHVAGPGPLNLTAADFVL